jgi:Flp pilus assembly pilin Flp
MATLRDFFKHEEGRVSIEYALLVVFVALASAEFYLSLGRNVPRVWSVAVSRLDTANTSGRRHQHRIVDDESSGCAANAQHRCADGYDSEPRLLSKHAQAESGILQ